MLARRTAFAAAAPCEELVHVCCRCIAVLRMHESPVAAGALTSERSGAAPARRAAGAASESVTCLCSKYQQLSSHPGMLFPSMRQALHLRPADMWRMAVEADGSEGDGMTCGSAGPLHCNAYSIPTQSHHCTMPPRRSTRRPGAPGDPAREQVAEPSGLHISALPDHLLLEVT